MSQADGRSSGTAVSVAMCTHEGGAFVEEQLASILGQTVPPDEVVVCDDASTDGTADRVAALADAHPSIRLVRNPERLGIRANFDQAVGLTNGDVVFLSDQDDVWLPRKVELMLEGFADPAVGFVRCDALVVDAELRPRGGTLLERHRRRPRRVRAAPFGVFGSATAFRRALAPDILPTPESWPHDVWIAFVATALSDEVVVTTPLQLYRRHEGSASPARFVDLGAGDRIRQDLRDAWSDRYRQSRAMWEAATDRFEELAAGHPEAGARLAAALTEVTAWRNLARFREELTERRRLTRFGPVVRGLVSGAYGVHGRPLAGALKDLVVRR